MTAPAQGDMTVELVKPWSTFVEGDNAGFNQDLARRLITMGVAKSTDLSAVKRTLRSLRDEIFGK